MKRLFTTLLLCFFILSSASAQDVPPKSEIPYDKIEERLKALETGQEQLEGHYALDSERLQLDFDRLSQANRNDNKTLLLTGGGAFLAILLAIFGGYGAIYNRLKNQQSEKIRNETEKEMDKVLEPTVDKTVRTAVNAHFLEHEEAIERKIASNGYERKLRENRSILVLCEDQDDADDMQDLFFHKLGFEKAKAIAMENFVSLEGYDLVVIDREYETRELKGEYEHLSNAGITNFLGTNKSHKYYVYFGPFNRELKPRTAIFNYANSRFTLYFRIIESLKYMDIVKN